MKLLLLADVSGSTSHVGDEAMLEANIALFRQLVPGCEISVAAGLGWDGSMLGVKVVPRLEFSHHSEVERDALLESLAAKTSEADHPAAIAACACDVLIISGGGNLSRNWPQYIYERIAMARLVASKGAKIILLGQTLGPEFSARERTLMTELLQLSNWTGLRETYSFALALELGADQSSLSYQLDDAVFLKPERPPQDVVEHLALSEDRPWIALTVHPLGDASAHHPTVVRLADCLRSLSDATGADIVFLPHVSFKNPERTSGDELYGAALVRALYANPSMRIAPLLPASQTLWLTQQASMVISTRYHPLVFGLAAAVPSIGIWTDEYTRRKIQGALIHAARPADSMKLEDALEGRLVTKTLELWPARSALRDGLQAHIARWRESEKLRISRLGKWLMGVAILRDAS